MSEPVSASPSFLLPQITEDLPDITVACAQELSTFLQPERRADNMLTFSWEFTLKSSKVS